MAGSLGRVKIAREALMPYLGGMFAPLWKVLDREKNLVAKLDSITFHKKSVEMVSKAGGR